MLFRAVLDSKEVAAALAEAGVNRAQLAAAVEEGRGSMQVDSATADTQFDALAKYGIDLTAKAAELDPVIGRDEEIRWAVRAVQLEGSGNEGSWRERKMRGGAGRQELHCYYGVAWAGRCALPSC